MSDVRLIDANAAEEVLLHAARCCIGDDPLHSLVRDTYDDAVRRIRDVPDADPVQWHTDAMRKDLTGLCDLDIRLPVLKAPRNRREEQLRMARDQGGKIAWLVMAATCRTTFKFGKDRLTRLLNESLANYRQFLEWDAEDHEYAVNKLCRIVEQALQEELKVADESKRTEFLSVSGITPHDYGEIMTAVHLARKDSSVPIAVLSQSEIDRRMGKLKRA